MIRLVMCKNKSGSHIQFELQLPKKISDTQVARNYLSSNSDKWFTVEEIKNNTNINIGVPALARKMREERKKGILESKTRDGKTYMEYRWVLPF